MAIATWPTRSTAESPNSTNGSAAAEPIRSTAKIRVRIIADEIGRHAGLLVQAHDQPLGAVHDMTVGEQIAVGREKKTGSGCVPAAA